MEPVEITLMYTSNTDRPTIAGRYRLRLTESQYAYINRLLRILTNQEDIPDGWVFLDTRLMALDIEIEPLTSHDPHVSVIYVHLDPDSDEIELEAVMLVNNEYVHAFTTVPLSAFQPEEKGQ